MKSEGLVPSQIIDLKSLMGDSSDNIPGVAGVGEKTAKDLLAKYSTLDGVYAHIDEIKGKLQEKLISGKEMAYLSYDLATINVNSPIEFDDLEKARLNATFSGEVKVLLKKLELTKIIDRLNFDSSEGSAVAEIFIPKSQDIDTLEGLSEVLSKIILNGKFAFSLSGRITISVDDECFNIVIADNLLGEGINYGDFLDACKNVFEKEKIVKTSFDYKNNINVLDKDLSLIHIT